MNKIKQLVKKWYFKALILLTLGISISVNFKQCNTIKINDNNISALTDSLKTTKNKLGEVIKSAELLILSVNDLKKHNSDLTKEINKLSSKDKRSLVEINKLNITIDMLGDSIKRLQPDSIVIINDSMKSYKFNRSNKFRELEWDVDITNKKDGTEVVTSAIITDKIYMDLVINKKKEGDKLNLSVSSSNPYVNVTDIQGSVIDLTAYNSLQKSKLFGLGVHVGYGLSINNSVVFLSPYIGIGLNYNLIKW